MVEPVARAITFTLKIRNYTTCVVLYAIIDVEVNADSTLAHQVFQVGVQNVLENLEVRDLSRFHRLGVVVALIKSVLVWVVRF